MISFIEIKSPTELEEIAKQYFVQDTLWESIAEAEKEMQQAGEGTSEADENVIAHKITDDNRVCGLIQYSYTKGGFLKKEQLVISLLSLVCCSLDEIVKIHEALIEKHGLKGRLIQAITLSQENTPICQILKEEGFKENRSSLKQAKYGLEAGSLYFVKEV